MPHKTDKPIVAAIKKVQDAVVSITASREISDELLANLPAPMAREDGLPYTTLPTPSGTKSPHEHERMEIGGGSGFLVSEDGLILTNKHVIKDASATYTVVLADNTVLPAEVLSRDPINDIAVIKIQAEHDFPVSVLGDSSALSLGETLIVIGNALGSFQNTVSVGVVSGLSRFLSAEDGGPHSIEHLRGLIQTDAAINPGNSGGPLVNIDGEVVGISVATVMGAQNLGFAIPINAARRDLEDIKRFGQIRKPFLGVHYIIVDGEMKSRLGLTVDHGAYVSREELGADPAVIEGSPGANAGLKEGDIVIRVDDKNVTASRTLQDLIEEAHIGDSVAITYVRDGEEHTVSTTLVERE